MTDPRTHGRLSPGYVARAAHALGILSHESRLHAVLLLAVLGETQVSALADALDISQSNLSHHLRILRDAKLVVDRREGQYVLYSLNIPVWRKLADGFFDSLLGGADSVTLQEFRVERRTAADGSADGAP